MLAEWLSSSAREAPAYEGFDTVDLIELQAPDELTKAELARRFQDSMIDPEFLAACAETLGDDVLAQYVRLRVPTLMRVRRGNFGEVLSAWVLEELHGYRIAIPKLQFAIKANSTLPGTDVLAIRLDESATRIEEVCYLESKLRTVVDNECACEGHDELAEDSHLYVPPMLLFAAQYLLGRGSELFPLFLTYLGERDANASESHRIFLTFDPPSWREKVLEKLEEHPPDLRALTAHCLLVADLRELIDGVLLAVGATSGSDG